MLKKSLLLTSVATCVLYSSNSFAADQMSMDEIQAQLQQLAAQVQQLSQVVEQQNKTIQKQEVELNAQKQVNAEAIEQAVANIQPAAGGVDTSDVKITMKPSPKIESKDGKYSFQPTGRVHVDASFFDDDASDRSSNANIRRGRLGFKGNLGEDFKYKTEVDFSEEGVDLKEVALTYTGLDTFDIKVGHHKPSFGFENNTSSNYILTMERSTASNAFTRSEMVGANFLGGGEDWSWGVGVFNESGGNSDTGDDEDISLDGRVTTNVLALMDQDTDNILHLGLGASLRNPTGNVRFRARPVGDGANIIDTGNFGSVEDVSVYNAELGAVLGPFTFQGEYFDANVSRDGNNSDADFDGYFAQIGYFLTGESRPYKASSGKFGRVKPNNPFDIRNGGTGAVELVAAYSNTDLNDAGAGILGGESDTTTFGVNWHLTNNIRLMGNVVAIDTDENASVADDDPTLYNFRAQWDF
ncbi:MAG: OprO/OprP family phosphate-selective porin [Bdellovibrionales bacterium]